MKRLFYVLSLSLFFTACSTWQHFAKDEWNEDEFVIYASKDKQSVNFNDFIELLNTYDIILLGEKHDEKAHHWAQYTIIKTLSQKAELNVVFEMLSTDKQGKIDKAKMTKEQIKAGDLSKAIDWEKGWKYEDYQAIVELAFYGDMKLSAGNISREEIKTIYKGAQQLNGFVSTKDEVKEMIKNIIASAHKVDTNESKNLELLDKLVQIQQYKDRRMADILTQSKEKAVLIAGRYHADKRIGVPLHIQDYKSSKKVLVVAFSSDKKDLEFKEADYIWLFK